MKAIILAAGQGTRLGQLTENIPKCLVELNSKSILAHQIDVLKSAGILDIHVVGGYLADHLKSDEYSLHINSEYAETNMVFTLFRAGEEIDGSSDLVISYGDIVYEKRVLDALLMSKAPISIVIDTNWKPYWEARMENPLEDAETLKVTDRDRIIEIGKKPTSFDQIQGQYTGLFKIRADHALRFMKEWQEMDKSGVFDGKSYKQMYMTSYLQHLIDIGWEVRATFVENGWAEIDNPTDIDVADKFWCP